MMLLHTVCVL